MTNRRPKVVGGATVVGLAALGGTTLGTNPGMPAASRQVAGSNGAAAVVTSASGAAATVPATQNVALNRTRPPIVTRASGGAGTLVKDD